MENSTGALLYEWEYYYDYLDPVTVDESKLKYNKYSIVIIFWIILAAFVGFLFLSLNLMSRSGNLTRSHRSKIKGQHRTSTAWSTCVYMWTLVSISRGQRQTTDGSDGCFSQWWFGCSRSLTLGSGHQTDMRLEQFCWFGFTPQLMDVQRQQKQPSFWKGENKRHNIYSHIHN